MRDRSADRSLGFHTFRNPDFPLSKRGIRLVALSYTRGRRCKRQVVALRAKSHRAPEGRFMQDSRWIPTPFRWIPTLSYTAEIDPGLAAGQWADRFVGPADHHDRAQPRQSSGAGVGPGQPAACGADVRPQRRDDQGSRKPQWNTGQRSPGADSRAGLARHDRDRRLPAALSRLGGAAVAAGSGIRRAQRRRDVLQRTALRVDAPSQRDAARRPRPAPRRSRSPRSPRRGCRFRSAFRTARAPRSRRRPCRRRRRSRSRSRASPAETPRSPSGRPNWPPPRPGRTPPTRPAPGRGRRASRA